MYSKDLSQVIGNKLEAVKVIKFISTCWQDKKLADAAFKLALPNKKSEYNFFKSKDVRMEQMRYLTLADQKLQMMEIEDGCDCDCINGRLKQVDAYLDLIK